MLDQIFAQLNGALSDARKAAGARLAKWDGDPYAKGMLDATDEIAAVVALLETDAETIDTAAYAEIHGVTPQTVCNWIRRKELEATGDKHTGYKIRRTAVRKPRALSLAS